MLEWASPMVSGGIICVTVNLDGWWRSIHFRSVGDHHGCRRSLTDWNYDSFLVIRVWVFSLVWYLGMIIKLESPLISNGWSIWLLVMLSLVGRGRLWEPSRQVSLDSSFPIDLHFGVGWCDCVSLSTSSIGWKSGILVNWLVITRRRGLICI